ncbi:PadR family transcriptional regulator [Paenibacillus woosongensis]|uniref:PadR family transcriptional regulator n=1 Tax=Paenibacillus woosongensis TaxID=307580 RepID=A0AA95ICK5_9BACL|nr:PadR family transcriptional regulator [Paenibacillus woosongensis]WHX50672.1 PadR family transcriptional regulator [Paenibacillus woosongensis]
MRIHDYGAWRANQPQRRGHSKEEVYQDIFIRHRHGGGRGGFGGRGEGRRFFERGKFKFALLELLASEPMHGYQLIKTMEEKTGGLYSPSPGSVYPNLQWLEDMQLIGSTEKDGKKLYHITNEGRTYLQEQRGEETERPEYPWEHPGRHRPDGRGHGKHLLRGLMKDWSEVVHLMARASEAAKVNPGSKQAQEFQEIMSKLRVSLSENLAAFPGSDKDGTVPPPSGNDPFSDDGRDGE